MDFTIPPDLIDLQLRTRAFIRDQIIPFEADPRQERHGPTDDLRRELNALARTAGLLSPHVATEYGGLGLTHFGRAIVFEEAGYSLLGPLALNISAPDEGNMHLLEHVATPAQKARWLAPLAQADIRSCFCMTEPPPGAGFAIIMAREADGRATMLLADMDQPGIRIVRTMDTLDQGFAGGHAVVEFDGLRVPVADVLGEPGQGFRYAQIRLAPARLTHCMRWLGSARRAQDIALAYATKREAFGKPLAAHEGVGFMLADNDMDIRTSRLTIWHTAWLLDQGNRAGTESSIAKVVCSEAIFRVADRCVQVLGGQGVTAETVVERIFREVRGFRIYDGPSEVHRWSLAQKLVKAGANH